MASIPNCAVLSLKAVPLVGAPKANNVFQLFDLIALQQSAGNHLPPALLSALNPIPPDLLLTTHIYDCTSLGEREYETYDVSVHFHPYVLQEVGKNEWFEKHVKVGVYKLDADFAQSMVKTYDNEGHFLHISEGPKDQLQEVTVTLKKEENALNCIANRYKLRVSTCLPVVVFYTLCLDGDREPRAAVTRHILLINPGFLGRSIALLAVTNNQSAVRESLCSALLDMPRSVTDWTNASEFLRRLTEMCFVSPKEKTRKELRNFLCFVVWREKGSPDAGLDFGTRQLEQYEQRAERGALYGLQRFAIRTVAEILRLVELISA